MSFVKYPYAVRKKGLEMVINWSFMEFTKIFYETDVSREVCNRGVTLQPARPTALLQTFLLNTKCIKSHFII